MEFNFSHLLIVFFVDRHHPLLSARIYHSILAETVAISSMSVWSLDIANKKFAERAFAVAGPSSCNKIPEDVRSSLLFFHLLNAIFFQTIKRLHLGHYGAI